MDCISINASASPGVVRELINRRVGELGKLLGSNVDLDTLQGQNAAQLMERYKKLLKTRFNMSVEEASEIFQKAFKAQREETRLGPQFTR